MDPYNDLLSCEEKGRCSCLMASGHMQAADGGRDSRCFYRGHPSVDHCPRTLPLGVRAEVPESLGGQVLDKELVTRSWAATGF
jgi:hypothetical protein